MSLQAILDVIEASGEARIQEIEARSEARVEAILAEAHSDAEELRVRAGQAARERAEKEASHVNQRANLEALNLIGETRESLVEEALGRARDQLVDARDRSDYPAVLARLIREALAALRPSLRGDDQPALEADLRDRALVERVLREQDADLAVSYSYECWGGVVARSADGRVVVTNTLESRFEEAAPYLRQQLSVVFEATLTENDHVGVRLR